MSSSLSFTLGSAFVLTTITRKYAHRDFIILSKTTAPAQKLLLDLTPNSPSIFQSGLAYTQRSPQPLTPIKSAKYFNFCYVTITECEQKELLAYFNNTGITSATAANVACFIWQKVAHSFEFLLLSTSNDESSLNDWLKSPAHPRFHCGSGNQATLINYRR